jgi:hypothetical protein
VQKSNKGYSPAYTLQAIAIQLLSFFSSEHAEQDYGAPINLKEYDEGSHHLFRGRPQLWRRRQHVCDVCHFNTGDALDPLLAQHPSTNGHHQEADDGTSSLSNDDMANMSLVLFRPAASSARVEVDHILRDIPLEVLTHIFEHLEGEDMLTFAHLLQTFHDAAHGIETAATEILRRRHLCCFVLKKGSTETKLGVGVNIYAGGNAFRHNRLAASIIHRDIHAGRYNPHWSAVLLQSEFELLFREAFQTLDVQTSVHGRPFGYWIPLALSREHYKRVQRDIHARLMSISRAAPLHARHPVEVVYRFMHDVCLKLSQDMAPLSPPSRRAQAFARGIIPHHHAQVAQSTHARPSEKAVESFYHLYHLLLCLAAADEDVVRVADYIMLHERAFFPAHLDRRVFFLAALVSGVPFTREHLVAVVRETMSRSEALVAANDAAAAAWRQGPLFAFASASAFVATEAPPISTASSSSSSSMALVPYGGRLALSPRAWEADKSSYRLLLLLNLLRVAVGGQRAGVPLAEMRDDLFRVRGTPPPALAAGLVASFKLVHEVEAFPGFLALMGL